jgi:phosphoribosylformimino-5-aminoimidazole carboxamide ribonucleotide (ProFAR) isomerase
MRIGATVLLKEQRCVQSYSWNTIRPLGSLQGIIDSLEEYQCDEVAIIRPVRNGDTLSSFERDIKVLKRLKTMTPLSFGGGIRSLDHIKLLKDLPVERIILSSVFLEKDREVIMAAIDLFGRQAIKCCLPIRYQKEEILIYHSSQGMYVPLKAIDTQFIDELANEIILFDTKHEGDIDRFDWLIPEAMPFPLNKIIVSGGVGPETIRIARRKEITSVLIDNKMLHTEYSTMGLKNA